MAGGERLRTGAALQLSGRAIPTHSQRVNEWQPKGDRAILDVIADIVGASLLLVLATRQRTAAVSITTAAPCPLLCI